MGLCLLLIISLAAMTIKDTEKNFAYDVANFQTELELQNAADSALIEAAEKIRLNPDELTKPTATENMLARNFWQRKISVSTPANSDRIKNISVEVYGERGKIAQFLRNYAGEEDYNDIDLNLASDGIILISVASGEEKITGAKKFRRALAYILDDEKNIINFMNDAERGNLKTT